MNYEEAISQIQGNARYNILAMLALSIMSLFYAMDVNCTVFISYTPQFECIDRSFNVANVTWIKKECHGQIQVNKSVTNVQCTKWKFQKDVMERTIVTDFDLVCDKESHVTIMNTLFFLGIAFGNFIAVNGDKIGRIRMIKIFVVWEFVINIILPFMPNVWAVFMLRFISGFSFGKLNQGMCYMAEIVSMDKRSVYANNYWVLYVVGYMLIPGIAFATRDWRLTRHIINIPMIFYILYFWMPESPRWLGSGGKLKEAKQSLLLIGKINNRPLPSNHFDSLVADIEILGDWRDIFRKRFIRTKTLILMFVHGTISLCYYALCISETFISPNIFINVFVQGSLEILTGPLAWIASTRLNRKLSLIIFFLITSVCLVLTNFINGSSNALIIIKCIFASIGKFCITTAYCIIDMYINEVFPTPIRNMAIFLILGIAATFTVLAPTINGIDKFVPYFSLLCFSVMCLISAIATHFMLPETKDCPLPQTLEQGEALRRGNEKDYCMMMSKTNNDPTL